MGCRKAWELLMRRMDGEIDRQNLRYLENHLVICPECREKHDSLSAVLMELDRTKPAAPESTEPKVMEKIRSVRHRETPLFLPYVVPAAALLTGILVFLFYEYAMDGPMAMINKAAQTLTIFYGAYQSVAAFSRFLFGSVYLNGVLIMTGLALLGGILAFLHGQRVKRGVSKYWRSVK